MRNLVCSNMAAGRTAQKKNRLDSAPGKVLKQVGLLVNRPPGLAGLPFHYSSDIEAKARCLLLRLYELILVTRAWEGKLNL